MSMMGRMPLPVFSSCWLRGLDAEMVEGWGCWESVEWNDSVELVGWRGWGWDDWEE